MASLFISYSRKDIDSARKLTEALEGEALDVWIDWQDIPPTVDWRKEIEKAIEEADVFLFLLGPDSAESPVCHEELEHAVKNGKRLIPIVVRDVQRDKRPEALKPLNFIYLRERDDFEKTISNLITAIKTDYAWVQAHRELLVKALEWERNRHKNAFLLRGEGLQDAEQQLVTNAAKEPHPTDLQRNYVLKSRQTSDRQRRLTSGIAIAVAVVTAGLAVFGFVQARLANQRANVALARQLAAQGQSIMTSENSKQMLAVLLATESMKRLPLLQATQILLNNTLGYPVATITQDNVISSVAMSPNGKYVISSGCDKTNENGTCTHDTAHVWDAKTGEEVTSMIHQALIISIAFSPDGTYILTGSVDGTARVWDVESGEEVSSRTYTDPIRAVAYKPDGTYLVAGESGDAAYVWDGTTGKEVGRATHPPTPFEHAPPLSLMGISPDGKHVVFGASYGFVRLWDLTTDKEIASIAHDSGEFAMAFSPDGKYVVSGGCDERGIEALCLHGSARVWNVETGKAISRITYDGVVTAVAFSPDGNYVISGGCDKPDLNVVELCAQSSARVWDAATGKETARLAHDANVTAAAISRTGSLAVSVEGHIAHVWETSHGSGTALMVHNRDSITNPPLYPLDFHVAISPDGNYIVSAAGSDNTSRVWEIATGREVARMVIIPGVDVAQQGSISSVAFSADGTYVVSSGFLDILNPDPFTRIWAARTGKEVARKILDSSISSRVFSATGKYIVSLEGDEVHIWDVASDMQIASMLHADTVTSVDFSSDEKYMVSGSEDFTARVWEVATGKEVVRMTHDQMVSSVAFSLDGKSVLSEARNTAWVWDAATGKEIARITEEPGVNWLGFSPDGKYIVSEAANIVRLWETESGLEVAQSVQDGFVTSLAWSSDSIYFAYASLDGTVRVWNATTGKEITRIDHDSPVWSIAFSPDGRYIVTGSGDDLTGTDSNARVWEISTGQEIARMTHDRLVTYVAFSPNGKYVVSGSGDSTIRAWVWQPNDLIAHACSLLTRNLTQAEWQQYIGDGVPYEAVCPDLPIEPEITSTP